MAETFLSIVIPAYNEEKRLPPTLEEVARFLDAQPYRSELIVVENGSQDQTARVAEEFARGHAWARVLRESVAGKGNAVRRGMLEATGEYRFLCDADLSMPIDELPKFLPPERTDFDVALGSREVKGSVRHGEPFYRHLMGRVFNWLVKILVLPGLEDTQCGFKCFRGEVAEDLFSVARLKGFSFDVEILFIANQRGYRLQEVPIHWYYQPDSRVRLVQDSLGMFRDINRIRRNLRRGHYGAPEGTRPRPRPSP